MVTALVDMDGTITDPRQGMLTCMRFALAEVGCECPPDDEIVRHIGPPLRDALRAILGTAHGARAEFALERFRHRYMEGGILENSVYPGIPDALADLRRRRVRVLLATSKPIAYATQILRNTRLAEYFDGVYGSELDGTRADKGKLIAYILERESLDRSATSMVGDRAQDILGARANGIASIGVLWGYGSREELVDAGASVLCQNPSMLCETIVDRLDPGLVEGDGP